jgi:hypothetical protein
MAVDDDEIDHREFDSRRNDTTPLMALVRDKPYSRGTLTSEGRTASREYQAFLERNRNGRGK